MTLTAEEVTRFHEQGYLFWPLALFAGRGQVLAAGRK